MKLPHATIHTGDALTVLRTLPDESVHVAVTSPPYFQQRDYGTAQWEGGDPECSHDPKASSRATRPAGGLTGGTSTVDAATIIGNICPRCGARRKDRQMGLEETPAEYVAAMVEVFEEVRRVLRSDGVLWIVIGDSYAGGGGHSPNAPSSATSKSGKYGMALKEGGIKPQGVIKAKDLCGIPWRLAFALQDAGWWLRQDIVWQKENAMPESVRDRCTKSHEYIFLLAKSDRYFYDHEAVKEPAAEPERVRNDRIGGANGHTVRHSPGGMMIGSATRNRRSVWTVPTKGFPAAHFAVYPAELIEPCILAGTSERGACPACGAPWERVVERTPMEIRRSDRGEALGEYGRTAASGTMVAPAKSQTTGWEPTCTCDAGGLVFDEGDFEVIASPTGERIAADPSMFTGRAGMNRPRGDNEGQRPITRYEQRRYADQLRNAPHREQMETEAGSAFAHYIRTDRSGARPVPQTLLDAWIDRGWLEVVEPPLRRPYDPVPCTVLDPFSGAGTTGLVALAHNRNYIGIELNAEYVAMSEKRIRDAAPLFNVVETIPAEVTT